jgi:endonuclease G
VASIDPEVLARAEKVLELVRDEWLRRPGVTAVDLGFKWSKGEMTDVVSLRVHVARKRDTADLSEAELFPREIDGVPIDVIAASYAPQTLLDVQPETAVDGRGERFKVVPIGVSVGCRFTTAGTLGAKVIDQDSGEEMILSNWHVLAGSRNVQSGLPIWQPGQLDGRSEDANVVAELTRWILGPYDAAVARLNGRRKVTSKTLEGTSLLDVTSPRLGMMVWKSGRTTGLTEGIVDGIKMKVPLTYPTEGTHLLEQVFRIVPRPGVGDVEISSSGDSGSVWVDEASGKAVGLHFAGEASRHPEHALAHNIDVVLETLRVRLPGQKSLGGSKAAPRPPKRRYWPRPYLKDSLSMFLRKLLETSQIK